MAARAWARRFERLRGWGRRPQAGVRTSDDAFYRLAVESIEDYAVFTVNEAGVVNSWNRGAENTFGWPEAHILGRTADMVFVPEDIARGIPAEEMRTAAERGRAVDERWHLRRDGTRFWGSGLMFPLVDDTGRRTGYVKVVRDLTERRAQEERILAQNRRLTAILDALPGIVAYVAPDERFVFANDAFCEAHRVNRDAAIGRTITEVVEPETLRLVRKHVDAALSGLPARFRERIPFRRGARWVEAHYVPDLLEDRTIAGFVALVVDVTEAKTSQEQLEALVQERTRALSVAVEQAETFAYTLAHHLRAPMRAIQGFSALAIQRAAHLVDAETRFHLDRIATESAVADRIIRDLLSYDRIARDPYPVGRSDLDGVVAHVVRQDPRLPAVVRVQGPLGKAAGNDILLIRALAQLFDNALKAAKPGEAARITVGAERADGEVRLWVQDEGIGIGPEDQGRVFEPFYRLFQHPGGSTGIGLAMVRRSLERMGGRVWVRSEPGKGTRFWLALREAD